MKSTLKKFALAVSLAMLAITTAQAAAPTGTARSSSTLMQGGSNSSSVWKAPAANAYKVFVQVLNGTATNVRYRVYPKGKSPTSTTCSSTDASYPCYQILVNQAVNQNKWVQLTLNGNVGTKWNFTSAGFVAVYANTSKATEWISTAQVIFQTPFKIGQTYQGGIIFYLDSAEQHGLIAAPTDHSIVDYGNVFLWWYNNSSNPIATGTTVGTGRTNTTAIIANQGIGAYAAYECDKLVVGAYSDWYLPSKDELNLMYFNIGPGAVAPLTNIGKFQRNYYWSSSAASSGFFSDAWYQSFVDGNQSYDVKFMQFKVRAIRSF